ncbi:MAG: SusC/RagA family TonB-linked outer membrane protein [Flavobacteriaceae bacterium]|nr:SusC/RagA family TonB-linked outer membrane protein [Flavobacteriaceae bacterium]
MKTKFNGILTLLLVFIVQITFAQERKISGVISDDLGPVSDITVKIKGTDKGTVTDFDGNYAIKAKTGDVIEFTHISYTTIEKVVDASNIIDVLMSSSGNVLDEVVVTALGIKRNARDLGYAVTTIKSKDLNEVRETNILNALQGKSPGLLIKNQSGNVGGSTRILIRGNSSLSGTVEPLFVVDGVPISNSNISTGSRITGGYDFGNRAQDINPDDIESISILKGASAAALYGSRASGGVILITTKKGKQGQKSNFSFNTSYRFEDALVLPDLQNNYAAGDLGVYDFGEGPGDQVSSGWGPSISSLEGQTYTNIAGETVPFEVFENGINDFYSNASVLINSFSFSGANDTDDYRLSLSHTEQKGLVPNSTLNRLNLSLNAGKKLNEKLKSRFNINYVRTNVNGTAAQGANDPNVLTSIINAQPITTDFSLFNNFIDENGNQINDPGGQQNNPYYITSKNATRTSVERFYGSASLEYDPFKDVNILARVGYDTYNDNRFLRNSIGTIGRLNGSFIDDNIRRRELTLDLIATYDKKIDENFNFTFRTGTQWNERVIDRLGNVATNLTVPDLYSPGNAEVNTPIKAYSIRRILGIFGDATLNYKNWLILNATGRNDISSTLPFDNNSFFYPSVSLSWVFTDALKIDSETINYGKIRTAWANVGGDTDPFLLDFVFNPSSSFFGQFGTDGVFPFDGQLAFNSSGVLADQNLKPSNQRTFEVGFEIGLFNNRLSIDATYYSNLNENDIVTVPTPQSSGFSGFLTNVGGVSNEGIEFQINAKILKYKDFSWDINYNFTKNETRVEDLSQIDGGALNLVTGFNGISVRAVEGEPFQLFGSRFARAIDEDGNEIENQILVDDDGLRMIGQPGSIGEIDPDFTMGITSTFKYKNWRLSSTFDYREGGLLFSNTIGSLRRNGLAAETAINRENLFIDPNTFTQPGGPGTPVLPNTAPISSAQEYWQAYSNASIVEGNTFDGTFIKWRELSLTYTFPNKFLDKTPFSQLQLGLQGRNLAIFNTEINQIDPESGLGGSGSQLDGIERGGLPTTKSFGFNLIANF